jgi:hypothetical protein
MWLLLPTSGALGSSSAVDLISQLRSSHTCHGGLHTGECEVRGNDIGGIGVHIGARVRHVSYLTTYESLKTSYQTPSKFE